MSALKNFYDKDVPSRNLWTTIPGLITLVLSLLVAFNVITIDQSGILQTQLTSLLQAGTAAYLAVMGIIAAFKATD
jgi:hypothetical protein